MTHPKEDLSLHYTALADCVFVDKMAGLNTHAADLGRTGQVELLEAELRDKLYVVHRLDKGTSGALVFARSPEVARELSELFEKREVKKKYLLLTDRRSTRETFEASSFIEKEKGRFVSRQNHEPNAWTRFRRLKSVDGGDLWEAEPLSGKPHQIRLHAHDAGIPLLGDDEHGGSEFPRLCLHSLSLEFTLLGKPVRYQTAEPFWAEGFFSREDFILQEAAETRRRLYGARAGRDGGLASHGGGLAGRDCLRLSHHEIDSYRMDQFGPQLWVYWYKESDPTFDDLQRFAAFARARGQKIVVRKMLNRGEDPGASPLWKLEGALDRWSADENGVRFELRTDSGLSPGLFLDQRENRRWVRANARDKRVLNLFSYTGGFSVNAALGGAAETATVDVSGGFLDWARENFKLNDLDPARHEFWTSDALVFLKGCYRRKRKFDLILCDPPSFGRSKNGVFSIGKNYEELVVNCLYCLEKNGLLLFSTNYEKWSQADLRKNIQRLKSQFSFTVLEAPRQGLDFERPDEEPLMKSILLRKS